MCVWLQSWLVLWELEQQLGAVVPARRDGTETMVGSSSEVVGRTFLPLASEGEGKVLTREV